MARSKIKLSGHFNTISLNSLQDDFLETENPENLIGCFGFQSVNSFQFFMTIYRDVLLTPFTVMSTVFAFTLLRHLDADTLPLSGNSYMNLSII